MKNSRLVLLVVAASVFSSVALADVGDLDRGHRVLVNRGLQISGETFFNYPEVPGGSLL